MEDEVIYLKNAIDKTKPRCDRYSMGYQGFKEAMRGGMKDGDLIIVSGKSGQGKTSFSQSVTYNLCKAGVPCLWFSYEVSLEHLNDKFEDMGISDFYEVSVPKKNTTGRIDWVRKKIIESVEKFNTKVVFIDHIDFLITSDIRKSSENTATYLKSITTELKSLAIELNIVIVCMAHLKKLSEDKEPDMEDIGYSAGIYQLADYVIIVQRERMKTAAEFGSKQVDYSLVYTNNALIKIVKNRETGITKIIKCQMVKNLFLELTQLYD